MIDLGGRLDDCAGRDRLLSLLNLANVTADSIEHRQSINETAKGELEPNRELDRGTAVMDAIPELWARKENSSRQVLNETTALV